jgi:hypothetical protein
MFKPYPTLADSGLFLSSLVLFPEVYPCLCLPLPSKVMTNVHPNRLPLPTPYCSYPPACGPAPPAVPQFVADNRDGQRELLLRSNLAIRTCKWNGDSGRVLGWAADRSREGVRRKGY